MQPTIFASKTWHGAVVLFAGLLVACGSPPPPPPPQAAPVAKPSAPRPAPQVSRPGPAAPPRRPATFEYFGTTVTDDFAWLEDGKRDEVRAFSETESTFARFWLDGLAERAPIRERVAEIYGKASPDWFALRAVGASLFAIKDSPPKQQPLLVVMRKDDLQGERVLLDPNVVDPAGKTTIDWYVPSPDGKRVAVSLSKDGTESGDVHVYDVATGREAGDVVRRVNGGTAGGSLAWNTDGSGFFYTRYPAAGERPEADRDFYQQVFFHKLGATESTDAYAIGKDFPRIAEVELERSEDGRFVMARVADGDGGEVEHHVLVAGRWVRLSRFQDGLTRTAFGQDGKIYALSHKGSPRGKVVAFAPPFDRPAEVVVPEGDAAIEDLEVTKTALYVAEVMGGPSRVRRFPLDPKVEPLAREPQKKGPASKTAPAPKATGRGVAAAELPIPAVSSVGGVVRLGGDDLLVRVESFTSPPAWFKYKASEHRLTKTALAKTASVDMSDVEVVRETCTSKDGTKVPMTVLAKRGAKRDGTGFALLTGYGGFAISRKPRLREWTRLWLDRGGFVADANLRGGGEFGEAWHAAGKLTQKQNVFDDFAACARALSDLGYARAEHLGITGRSNGGLLMGAAVAQHPELYRAVVAGVGIYDMLRSESTPNGTFNVTEYGSVHEEPQFRAMLGYSPLHNVKDGVAYPAMLFTTGANDPRVDPFHSRKMVARLKVAATSAHPILLLASSGTGHGMGTPLSVEIDETTDMLAFLLHELTAR